MPQKDSLKYKEYQKAYRLKHREQNKKYQKRYKSQPGMREIIAGQRVSYLARKPWAKTLVSIKGRCRGKKRWHYKQGIKCLITLKELEVLWYKDKAYTMKRPSIDRLKGGHYTFENCKYPRPSAGPGWGCVRAGRRDCG